MSNTSTNNIKIKFIKKMIFIKRVELIFQILGWPFRYASESLPMKIMTDSRRNFKSRC